jgi:hypothetical protein
MERPAISDPANARSHGTRTALLHAARAAIESGGLGGWSAMTRGRPVA